MPGDPILALEASLLSKTARYLSLLLCHIALTAGAEKAMEPG